MIREKYFTGERIEEVLLGRMRGVRDMNEGSTWSVTYYDPAYIEAVKAKHPDWEYRRAELVPVGPEWLQPRRCCTGCVCDAV